jgi:hypothetical protein
LVAESVQIVVGVPSGCVDRRVFVYFVIAIVVYSVTLLDGFWVDVFIFVVAVTPTYRVKAVAVFVSSVIY